VGNLTLSNNASLVGSGVTFIVTGSLTLSGNAALTLSAPKTGASPGFAIVATTAGTVSMLNNGTNAITGMIYAPAANLLVKNASSLDACLEIVVNSVVVEAGVSLTTQNCSAYGLPDLGSQLSTISARLVL